MFDFAVVGKGLMGAACARHLSKLTGGSIALIGPDEPPDLKRHQGVFASHYDSGRITRILDTDKVWGTIAKRSIDRYREIEKDGGLEFFHPAGCLKAVPGNAWGESYLQANKAVATPLGAKFETLDAAALKKRFPYFGLVDGAIGIIEVDTAGWIDPRKMLAAQIAAAENQGVKVIRETVVARESIKGEGSTLKTSSGTAYDATTVVVAAGGFTNFNGLLPEQLNLTVRRESVVMAHISDHEAQGLREMPSLIYFFEDNDKLDYIYSVPPIAYPDGSYYMKMGGNYELDYVFNDLNSLEDWFHSDGGEEAVADFKRILSSIIPKVNILDWKSKPCVITDTATERPYVGRLRDGTVVVTGGCGAAAKSADEIGRQGALCALEKPFDDCYQSDDFKVVLADAPARQLATRKYYF